MAGYWLPRAIRERPLTPATPLLIVERLLHFPRAEGAVYTELFCRTDRFVYAQTLGGSDHG